MEITSEDGLKIKINPHSALSLGRITLSSPSDKSVSHCHLSLEPSENLNCCCFQVTGVNPVWVVSSRLESAIKVFRRSEKGELRIGDRFCVSGKDVKLFTLREVAESGRRDAKEFVFGGGDDDGDVDVDVDVDVVKEFGFLVLGHEFDNYPRQKIRDIRNWDWFLEEPNRNNNNETDDENEELTKRKRSRNMKGTRTTIHDEGNDEEDWSGESEEEIVGVSKLRKGKRPRYSTLSEDSNKPLNPKKEDESVDEEEAYEDEDADEDKDEVTLGGFIVTDEEADEDENSDEEEEEDFDNGEDDD